MSGGEGIVRALSAQGRRITAPRRTVARALEAQERHFTAADLLEASQRLDPDIARATIVRSLELLTDAGLVERVDLADGTHAYVVCRPDRHHHHIVCERCGRSADVGDLGLQDSFRRVEEQTGYRLDSHRLELFGVCSRCAETADAGR